MKFFLPGRDPLARLCSQIGFSHYCESFVRGPVDIIILVRLLRGLHHYLNIGELRGARKSRA